MYPIRPEATGDYGTVVWIELGLIIRIKTERRAMLRPVEMCKVNILVLRKHVAAVTQLLGAREVLHLVDATAQSPGRLLTSFGTADAPRLRQLSDKCAALIRQLDITGGAEPAADMTIDEMAERLDVV